VKRIWVWGKPTALGTKGLPDGPTFPRDWARPAMNELRLFGKLSGNLSGPMDAIKVAGGDPDPPPE